MKAWDDERDEHPMVNSSQLQKFMYRNSGESDLFIDIAVLVKAIDSQAQICQMVVDELDRVGETMLRFSQSRPIVSNQPAFFPAWIIEVAQHQVCFILPTQEARSLMFADRKIAS